MGYGLGVRGGEAEETHRLELHDFVSHFRGVSSMFIHGAAELRGVVALHIVDPEMLAQPLPDVFIGAFASDVTELTHCIDSGSKILEVGRMLLRELEMVEQMILHLCRHIIRPETYLFFWEKALS